MHSLKIIVRAITEFHEPRPYKYFPSLFIDVFELSGGNPNVETLLIHRCEDINGLGSFTDKGEALIAAREWLGEEENYKSIVEAFISDFGE